MSGRMVMMRIWMRGKKNCKAMMDQRRMWRTGVESSDVDGYEYDNGDDTDTDGEDESLQTGDETTQSVEHWGHSTRECEDWTVYFRHVKYDNGDANAMTSNVSKRKTIVISDTISKLNINKSVVCGYQPKKGINIASCCVNGCSITAATVKNVTEVSFWWYVYITAFQVHSKKSK
jgi:hypothetical protein